MDNAKRFCDGIEMIINVFKNKIFPLHHDHHEESRFEEENDDRDENGLTKNGLDRLIFLKERDINDELVKTYFLVQDLGALLKD